MKRFLLALALTELVSFTGMHGLASGAEPATGVDHVEASLSAGLVLIQGTARFVDVPVQVGSDPSGDASIAGRGAEVVAATISRPDPLSDELRFSLGIGDLPSDAPAVGVDYVWCLEVLPNGVDTPPVQYQRYMLQGFRKPSGGPGFRLGGSACTGVAPAPTASGTVTPDPGAIAGSVGDGRVTFHVPFQKMTGLKPGALIRRWQLSDVQGSRTAHVGSSVGLLGFEWYGSLDAVTTTEYTVPSPKVRVGIALAGTPIDQVPLTTPAAIGTDSSFGAAIPLETIGSGDYIVVAEACYAENCGYATTSFSI